MSNEAERIFEKHRAKDYGINAKKFYNTSKRESDRNLMAFEISTHSFRENKKRMRIRTLKE